MDKIIKKRYKVILYIGTVFVWIPIFGTILISILGSIFNKKIMIDYLMPAEFFLFAVVGSILLFIAARVINKYEKRIALTFASICGFLIATQGSAILLGLAHGDTEPKGFPLFVIVMLLLLYAIAIVLQCIWSVLLVKQYKLFK